MTLGEYLGPIMIVVATPMYLNFFMIYFHILILLICYDGLHNV
jgi:hypothetical protein